jgi:hypothetical protein
MSTKVITFLDGKEQRWVDGDPLNDWDLTLSDISAVDVATLRDFFLAVKGAFDSTWTFPFLGTSYTSMAFDQDKFEASETARTRYSVKLKLKQTATSGTYTGSATEFPTIGSAAITQLPYTAVTEFLTTRNDLAGGIRYAYYERATPLSGWTCTYSAITPAELGTILTFFISMRGRFGSFSFTDIDSAIKYENCRLAQDSIDLKYNADCSCSTDLQIIEFAI